jgi:hypothetical protein
MAAKELNRLYERYGYKKFKMSKFEPYELYVENKNFLNSNQVISFTDLDGELLALKPDVTLSILKSGLGEGRIYYNENVYRPKERHFRESAQTGIEYIGKLTAYAEAEVIALAVKSLKLFSDEIRIRISDVGLLSDIFEKLSITDTGRILRLFETKNVTELDVLVSAGEIDENKAEILKNLINLYLPFGEGVKRLAEGSLTGGLFGEDNVIIARLKELAAALKAFNVIDNIYLDFSVINSMDYYNGIIFQGAIEGLPFTALSGGRYDKLAAKMGKDAGAIGFALDLSLVEDYKEEVSYTALDYIIIYDEKKDDITKAVEAVERLIKEGYKVELIEKDEEKMMGRIRAKQVLELRRMI